MIDFNSFIILCHQISDVFFHIHPVNLGKKLCPITIASFTSKSSATADAEAHIRLCLNVPALFYS